MSNTSEVSTKLKQRFCKDCGIPINVFKEPYFTKRLYLFNPYFNTIDKWNSFLKELEEYDIPEDFLKHCNQVIDNAVEKIKNSEGYIEFNNMDMNNYYLPSIDSIPGNNFYKDCFIGRTFIILDMVKANFSSLHYYNSGIFDNAETWEEFIGGYTDSQYIKNSKYIRQVILGKCNSKRHTTYERILMKDVLNTLTQGGVDIKNIVYLSNEEIIIDITDLTKEEQEEYKEIAHTTKNNSLIPLHTKVFTLHKVEGVGGYFKEILLDYDIDNNNPNQVDKYVFKCISTDIYPIVIKKFLGQEIEEDDKVFVHDGKLAMYLDVPEITFR